MQAITHKHTKIKVAKWGTPKKYFKKPYKMFFWVFFVDEPFRPRVPRVLLDRRQGQRGRSQLAQRRQPVRRSAQQLVLSHRRVSQDNLLNSIPVLSLFKIQANLIDCFLVVRLVIIQLTQYIVV
jgi:hypothetical protein